MSHEFLQIVWFVLIAVLWIGFFFLEGFDFGVGMLMPCLGNKDKERRAIINSIGRGWNGNEVGLITAGGAMFAAFPQWYATMFSGFYLALFLLLVGLIIRGISFEYRSHDPNPKWRNTFDWMIAVGSFLPSLLLGVAFADLVHGLPINQDMMFTGNFFTLLNPYSLIGGLTMVSVFLLHGANFLTLKLEGELRERARTAAKKIYIAAAGIVLSQPTRQTSPSRRWRRATSSSEAAIVARETSEARIPSVPIETPSEIAIVLNSSGVPPASMIPRRTCRASSR